MLCEVDSSLRLLNINRKSLLTASFKYRTSKLHWWYNGTVVRTLTHCSEPLNQHAALCQSQWREKRAAWPVCSQHNSRVGAERVHIDDNGHCRTAQHRFKLDSDYQTFQHNLSSRSRLGRCWDVVRGLTIPFRSPKTESHGLEEAVLQRSKRGMQQDEEAC